jgi:hypothetical protein
MLNLVPFGHNEGIASTSPPTPTKHANRVSEIYSLPALIFAMISSNSEHTSLDMG